MNNSYSLWPVILIPYNLPPWLAMKDPFFMLSLLILGESQPGIDIDVYMRPLVDELIQLWKNDTLTCDASTGETFCMGAALLWTIYDWPTFSDMSGWRTKSHYSCYTCNNEPYFESLRSKTAYTNHRCYLPEDHLERKKSRAYNGKHEKRKRSLVIPIEKIQQQLDSVTSVTYGKHLSDKKRLHQNPNWTKLLTDPEREREGFFEFLKSVKYPDGYVANISRSVNAKNGRLTGLKSHDCHVLIQRILPIGMRGYVDKEISIALFELAFFDVMVHLAIHLSRETILGGLVQYRWMYPIERLFRALKKFVTNRARPEEIARPIGQIRKHVEMSQELRDIARWFLLYNSPEIEKYLQYVFLIIIYVLTFFMLLVINNSVSLIKQNYLSREHKNLLQISVGQINGLRVDEAPETTEELWSLANGPNLLVKEYSGCIINGVRFHTKELDNRFVLFQCKWYNTGDTSRSRTVQVDTYCTSIDVTSRWYQSDPFILPSQAKQVFYLNDTKWRQPWQVVQQVQHRDVFDVPKVGDGEPSDQPEFHDAFQQENINSVVSINIEDIIRFHRDDIEANVILNKTMRDGRDDKEDEELDILDDDMDPDMEYDM
ncbi:uncharacterized protein LOC114314735 [Camellia sinensis]|uniref:uncharacterized protein LOC114314735 n=1 Tax=Camellia sinensis TaxID=4442 RepID=UPI001035699D|nr:uncharacterized protein LOC114314735 [Camellia sinensis]